MNKQRSAPIAINNNETSINSQLDVVTSSQRTNHQRHDSISQIKSSITNSLPCNTTFSPGLSSPTPPTFVPDGSHQVARIGKYILVEHVEGHNTGNVFRAVDCNTDMEYICKVYEATLYRNAIKGYMRVAEHPNINNIVDLLVGPQKAYLFLHSGIPMKDNCKDDISDPSSSGFKAENLHSFVRSKRFLSESVAASLFKQVVSAVSHCHTQNIVLRDLKLRKFIFRNEERTEVLLECLDDASVLDSSDDRMSDRHGCPAYASPEILSTTCATNNNKTNLSTGYSGKASDVWSLGVMLYTMLVGRYPFHEPDPIAMFAKISRGHFTLPDKLSSHAKDLIKNLLRIQPALRLTAQEILDHPWLQRSGDCWDTPRQAISLGCGGNCRSSNTKTFLQEFGRHTGSHSFPSSFFSPSHYDDQLVPELQNTLKQLKTDENVDDGEMLFEFG